MVQDHPIFTKTFPRRGSSYSGQPPLPSGRAFSLTPNFPEDPAFSFRVGAILSPLTYRKYIARLRSLLEAAGFPPSAYAGHSLRRGGGLLGLQVWRSWRVYQTTGRLEERGLPTLPGAAPGCKGLGCPYHVQIPIKKVVLY